MHSILEVGSEQLRLFYYTAQERQIQMKYDALLVAHRVNSNTQRFFDRCFFSLFETFYTINSSNKYQSVEMELENN